MKRRAAVLLVIGISLAPLHAQNTWNLNFTPLYNMLISGNNEYIGSEYYFSYTEPRPGIIINQTFGYETIQKPIILHMKPSVPGFDLSAWHKKEKWRIGIQTYHTNMSAKKNGFITTPGRISDDDGRKEFTNGITLWDFNFSPLTNLSQGSKKSPIWWQANNSVDIWTHEILFGYALKNNLELTLGLKYAQVTNTQRVFQKQIVYLDDLVEVTYEDNFTMVQNSKAKSYLTGPEAGITFNNKHILKLPFKAENILKLTFETEDMLELTVVGKAKLKQSILVGDINHKNDWTLIHDVVVTVFLPDSSYIYNAWKSVGDHPFFYKTRRAIVPNTELEIEYMVEKPIYKNLKLNVGIYTSASIYWGVPTVAKLSLPQGSPWALGGQWTPQEKTLAFINIGVTFGINF